MNHFSIQLRYEHLVIKEQYKPLKGKHVFSFFDTLGAQMNALCFNIIINSWLHILTWACTFLHDHEALQLVLVVGTGDTSL